MINRKLKNACAISLLALAGCAFQAKQEKNEGMFPYLHLDPLSAELGIYEPLLRKGIQKVIAGAKEGAPPEGYELYDAVDGCRGDQMMDALKRQITDEDLSSDNLLFVFIGSQHMNSAYLKLSEKYNTYFFSECSYAESYPKFKEGLEASMRQFNRTRTFQDRHAKGKPIALVYGENHAEDFDPHRILPGPEELRSKGVRKFTVAFEGVMPRENLTMKYLDEEWEHFQYKHKIQDYLLSIEKSGIEFKVLGIEVDSN